MAYARWAGKQLPTEAQWEYAARGGGGTSRFTWGDTLKPDGQNMANTWDGEFPHINTLDDGFRFTAPVKSYPPNGYGLYDTIGNVWEWTADWYRDDRHVVLAKQGLTHNPPGPNTSSDATHPGSPVRAVKGGSFLCHINSCANYRPTARQGLAIDTGLQHTGFRCIRLPD